MPFSETEKFLRYSFRNKKNLEMALLHSSAGGSDFERMEFLGDRVLSLSVSTMLYRKYPSETEGDLAKRHAFLVSGDMIAKVMDGLNLFHVVKFDRCVREKHFESIKIDVCEAIFAAIFLDTGFNEALSVISLLWSPFITEDSKPPVDPKTFLQEYLQSIKKALPEYKVIGHDGPSHAPVFTIQLAIKEDGRVFVADGLSKQEAEKNAAFQALRFFKKV